ncbi:MAG: OsmC family protein [Betaproteobacteria bacterium]|nr:OsmC family protein [Betaproteobacteria bacterium]
MVVVKPKMVVTMKLEGTCASHSRTDIRVRDLASTIDEPLERGGSNKGLSPTETLMAALIGCTNTICHRVAEKNGVAIRDMKVRVEAEFDRRGVTLAEEVEIPFPNLTLYIDLSTDADDAALDRVKRELAMFCPVSKVIRASGTRVNEVWTVSRP